MPTKQIRTQDASTCPYLTSGKLYNVHHTVIRGFDRGFCIEDDEGDHVLVLEINDAHTDFGTWEVVQEVVQGEEAPLYVHDCADCAFLGSYDGADLYLHPDEPATVIARFSDEGSDYLSGLSPAMLWTSRHLQEAYNRAKPLLNGA